MVDPQSAQAVRENLLYIRKTLEAAGQITAVPGWGLLAAGILSVAGAAFNAFVTGAPWSPGPYPHLALATWSVVLCVSVAIVAFGMYRKSRQTCAPIQPPLLRKLLWSLCPALFVPGPFSRHLPANFSTQITKCFYSLVFPTYPHVSKDHSPYSIP